MFRHIKQLFIGSLASMINASNHRKYTSLNNKQFMTQTILIIMHPNEYSQILRFYPFPVNLDKCMGSCNTLNDLSNAVCALSKTENLNLNVFNMITRKMNQER